MKTLSQRISMQTIRLLYTLCILFLLSGKDLYADKKIKVACIGNSITYGTGVKERELHAYPVVLQRMLGEKYDVQNFGKPGATLLNKGHRPYTQQQEYKDALQFAADVVVIHLGINDTDPRNWPNHQDEFLNDYKELVSQFRKANPKARILVSQLTPLSHRHWRFESGTRDWHAEIQQAIELLAKTDDVQLIDLHTPLYPFPHLIEDAVHPNAEGAAIIAKTVYENITGDFGGLSLSSLYTDNMVLQCEQPLTITGKANSGEKISVTINGETKYAKTSLNGRWSVKFPPLKAGGPYTVRISSPSKECTFKNVMAGEVWLCSGQSNMEFLLRAAQTGKTDIPFSDNTQIRLFDMKARWRTNPVEWPTHVMDSLNHLQYFSDATWQTCTPLSAANFSAIAYYFGKKLQDSLQVPVGLICNAVGGAPTEAWIDRNTLEFEFPAILRDWIKNDFIQDWVRGRAALNIKKATSRFQRHPYEPCYLYESGILPIKDFTVKGVIWYQGESNAHNKDAHEKLFKLLVHSWRKHLTHQGLPFYYVQLSSLNRPSWPWFRDSQRLLLHKIANTGMAVSSDCGDSLDVHPTRKREIGERLASWALHKTYSRYHVVPSGPLYKSASFRKGAAYLSFDHAENLRTSDGAEPSTFEIAGEDHVFHPAKALIMGELVKVWSKHVPQPRIVRYGWQPFTRANLVNGAGLPASTFRTDTK